MNIRKEHDYTTLFAGVDRAICDGLPQMKLYCELGRLICVRPEKGTAVATAMYLSSKYPEMSGFSPRNLRRMRDFYKMYAGVPELLAQAMKLGWTQNVVILEADLTMEERSWYIQAAGECGWSKLELKKRINESAHLEETLVQTQTLCYTEQDKPSGKDMPKGRITGRREENGAMTLFVKKRERHDGIRVTGFSCVRDGLMLRGKEYRPSGSMHPAAIVCHGFMANQSTVTQYTEALARMGYAAYCFDFNGGSVFGSKSDGKSTEMSVLTEVQDLESVIDYVSSRPYIDSSNILLMGCSQGGFVSALTAAKRKDQVARLVLFYPALCIPDDARAGRMMMARFDPQNVPERLRCGFMRLGRCYVTDVQGMDPFAELPVYEGPVLIVHGTKDSIVAPEYAKRAYEAYKGRPSGNEKVQLRMIKGGRHGFSGVHDKIAIEMLRRFAGRTAVQRHR